MRSPRLGNYGPLLAWGGLSAGAVAARLIEPGQSAVALPCPLFTITGIYCPGCGMTRAAHELMHLDLAAAAQNNVLFLVALPVLIYALVVWTLRPMGLKAPPQVRIGRIGATVIAVVALSYMVARNIGTGPLAYLVPIPV